MQKVYFLRLMRVSVGLMLAACTQFQVSLIRIGQQDLGHFFRYWDVPLEIAMAPNNCTDFFF
jgi:hypothetical protein